MSDLFWLTDEQMAKLCPFLSKSHGKPRVDDRRVLSLTKYRYLIYVDVDLEAETAEVLTSGTHTGSRREMTQRHFENRPISRVSKALMIC